jgi:DNA-binding NtrC family response regulator
MFETPESQLNVLVVEYRDEVFARLAADLGAVGLRVRRADTATKAAQRHSRRPANLILLSAHLPDQSAWLFSSKLRRIDAATPVWVYTAQASSTDVNLANFVQADELIDYGGDLWKLAAEVAERLGVPASSGIGALLATEFSKCAAAVA